MYIAFKFKFMLKSRTWNMKWQTMKIKKNLQSAPFFKVQLKFNPTCSSNDCKSSSAGWITALCIYLVIFYVVKIECELGSIAMDVKQTEVKITKEIKQPKINVHQIQSEAPWKIVNNCSNMFLRGLLLHY